MTRKGDYFEGQNKNPLKFSGLKRTKAEREDLGFNVEAVHCNFGLRGDESLRDEEFCRQLCKSRCVEIHVAHFDTRTYAGLHRVSIEMAARELRYDFFRRLRHDIGAETICVAHHRDDNVETVLLNLVRGTGIHGLKGISPRNEFVVRPLLCVGRNDVENYLSDLQQDYVTDSTNLVSDVKRNRIRLEVLPLLKTINPSVAESIDGLARRIQCATGLFDAALEASEGRVICENNGNGTIKIDVSALESEPSAEYTLYNILSKRGFSSTMIEEIYGRKGAASGRQWHSATHRLALDRGKMVVEPLKECDYTPMKMPEDGRYVGTLGTFAVRSFARNEGYLPSKTNDLASLDADKLRFPLTVRRVEKGDRFVPFGMNGSRLVSDYLTDRKLSVFEKQRQRVVCSADGRIVWIVGERTDNRFRIDDTTHHVVEIAVVVDGKQR